jgi:hypothetical protein
VEKTFDAVYRRLPTRPRREALPRKSRPSLRKADAASSGTGPDCGLNRPNVRTGGERRNGHRAVSTRRSTIPGSWLPLTRCCRASVMLGVIALAKAANAGKGAKAPATVDAPQAALGQRVSAKYAGNRFDRRKRPCESLPPRQSPKSNSVKSLASVFEAGFRRLEIDRLSRILKDS